MRRRKKKRGRLVVWLLAVVALALTAGLLWRWVGIPAAAPDALRATPLVPARAAAPTTHPAQEHEEFSAAERQRLEDILRQKKAGAPR